MKETVFLNNDREMPLLGLGVYKLPDDVQAEAAVTSAISAGYRMIDTASVYKNEESVGRAIAKCGVPRKDLFITSKIWNTAQRLGDIDLVGGIVLEAAAVGADDLCPGLLEDLPGGKGMGHGLVLEATAGQGDIPGKENEIVEAPVQGV